MMTKQKLSGIYLIVDPTVEKTELLEKVEQALEGGVDILQVWNHWPEGMRITDKEQLITFIIEMADNYEVPVLINEAWKFLKSTPLDGVHFDEVPENLDRIKGEIDREFITGITCSNDLDRVEWADKNGFDYISFCAMFPSPSVGSCEIVRPETVQKARERTDLPLFVSGGITPEKITELDELNFDGIAVISGILNEDNPKKQASKYKQLLNGE